MFTTTIDSILKDFNVKIAKLKAISTSKLEEVEFHETAIEVATELRDEAKAEAARAASIASKIEALVG